jgi:hypothetical protein
MKLLSHQKRLLNGSGIKLSVHPSMVVQLDEGMAEAHTTSLGTDSSFGRVDGQRAHQRRTSSGSSFMLLRQLQSSYRCYLLRDCHKPPFRGSDVVHTYIDDRLPQHQNYTIVPDTSCHTGAKPCSCPCARRGSTAMVSLTNILCGTQADAATDMVAFTGRMVPPDSRSAFLRTSSTLRCDVLACLRSRESCPQINLISY